MFIKQKYISPLTWIGGKQKHFLKIKYFFPDKFEFFIDAFCGGSSVGLNVLNNFENKKVIFNDINYELIQFYNDLKNKNINIELLEKLCSTNNNFEFLKENKNNLAKSDLYFVNNAVGYSGFEKSTWTLRRFKENFNINKINRLKDCQKLLLRTNNLFLNENYEKLITSEFNLKNTLWYFDPPYFYNKGKVYKYGQIDFLKLKENLCKIKGKWILSIDDSEFIINLFKEFNINHYSWAYNSSNVHKSTVKFGKELIITNF